MGHDHPTQPMKLIPTPLLRRLDIFVGTWDLKIPFSSDPPVVVHERTTFEWMEGGLFLIQHSTPDHPDFPKGLTLIGGEDATETCPVYQFDSRGIFRIYQMSLSDGIWKMWRDEPGFFQRFTGKFSSDGNSIAGTWERSSDNVFWELDFAGTYTRVKTAQ